MCVAYSMMERQSSSKSSPDNTHTVTSSVCVLSRCVCVCVYELSFQIRLAQQGRGADNIVDVASVDIES